MHLRGRTGHELDRRYHAVQMTTCPTCRPFPLRSVIAGALLVAAAITGLSSSADVDFTPYFGNIPPTAAATIVCLTGIVALYVLQRRFSFCVLRAGFGPQDLLMSVLAAVPFMIFVTLADLLLAFAPETHFRLPVALTFYAAMGVIAQLSLHVIPFALLLLALARLLPSWPLLRNVRISIALSATIEALFQLGATPQSRSFEVLGVFILIQLFLFGVVELWLFRRFDFVCMYAFRLAYYAYWHLLWPGMRL